MNRFRSKIFCAFAMIVVALFAMACLIGFAACGGESEPCTTHTVTTWDSTTDATCTENGSRTGVCDVCGETVTETIPALGHNFVADAEAEGNKAANCTEDGLSIEVCTNCGREQEITIPATGHSYTSEITKAATATEDGEMTYTCQNCGDTYTAVIPKTGDDDDYEYETDTGTKQVYRFEAEDAVLSADENELWYWLTEDIYQGEWIVNLGFLFDVQTDTTASGGKSVGYLAHNKPTATFYVTSDKDYRGLNFTLGAASCDVNTQGASTVFGLMTATVNDYAGASHDILTVNGKSVALTGTLNGASSVFDTSSDTGLSMSNWGTLTASINLKAGVNTIVLTHDGAGVNWDYIEIETSATLSMNITDNSGFASYDEDYEPATTSLEALPVSMKQW